MSNGGHGTTLEEISNSPSSMSFLISTGNLVYENKHYPIELGLLNFNILYPQTIYVNGNNIPRITDVNYANKDNINAGTIRSVAAALTPDKTKLLIYARLNGNNKVQYSIYNFNVIKDILKKYTKSTFQNNASLKAACEFSAFQEGENIILPNNNFQGITISNKTNNTYSIYIASGEGNNNKKLIVSKITCNVNAVNNSDKIKHASSRKVVLPVSITNPTGTPTGERLFELEGIHIIDNRLYIGTSRHGSSEVKDINYICYVPVF